MLSTAEETIETYQNDNKLLKNKFDNINQEFHKFVAFIFNTVPKQAEFVLPLESICSQQMNKTLNEKLDRRNDICQNALIEK